MSVLDELAPGLSAFRTEIRSWLEDNLEPDLQGLTDMGLELAVLDGDDPKIHAAYARYEQAAMEARWVCPHWPEEVGGRGLDDLQMAVLAEEHARMNMPRCTRGMGERLVGPAIIAHATPEQKAHFLPRIIDRTDWYCQGFSEPDAGSDLAAVTTRGIVEGDEVVVTGQKIWTSKAHIANMMFALVRTDPDVHRHRGISYVLIPMHDNGIEVTEIVTMAGDNAFSQEYIEGARAPLFNVIGGLGGGWQAAMTTLGSERGAAAATQHLGYAAELDALIEEAHQRGRLNDPVVRDKLATAWSRVELMRFAGQRLLSDIAAGESVAAQASITKISWSEYHRDFGELAMEVLGVEGLVRPDGDGYAVDRWQKAFLSSRAETIFAGTSEIQRRIIAQRVLGLPRGATA